MTTILVATDFSAAAHAATDYGLKLAEAFHARVVLATAWQQIPIPVSDTELVVSAPDVSSMVQRRLQEEVSLLHADTNLPVGILPIKGPTAKAIIRAAEETKADIILAGMKSSGVAGRHFFGSTVTALARKTKIPLMVIPESVKYTKPECIALANDITSDESPQLLDSLQRIVHHFRSRLYVIRVLPEWCEDRREAFPPSRHLDRILHTMQPVFKYPVDNNIVRALATFIDTHKVDILAMVPHPHPALERWLGASQTREMIFQARIPLLILPDLRIPRDEINDGKQDGNQVRHTASMDTFVE
jgi:nucleotide-binding universal stress UspA family protein